MRITGSVEYTTEHGSHGVDIVCTWDVPYFGWANGETIEEIEAGDNVLLTKLKLVAGGIERELALPVGPMLAAFLKSFESAAIACQDELTDLFCEDARDTHNFHREEQYSRERDWARSA